MGKTRGIGCQANLGHDQVNVLFYVADALDPAIEVQLLSNSNFVESVELWTNCVMLVIDG